MDKQLLWFVAGALAMYLVQRRQRPAPQPEPEPEDDAWWQVW